MAGNYDETTRQITLPCGDTFDIWVDIDWPDLAEGDVVLFGIFDKNTGNDILVKYADIEDGKAHIRLCNKDTRDVEPATYRWNLRIVTDPVRDDDGNVRVDECEDDVITVFDDPPRIKLWKGGAYV